MDARTKEVIRKYQELKEYSERKMSEYERSKGATEQLRQRSEEEFGCRNEEELKELLAKIARRREKVFARFDRLLRDVKLTYKNNQDEEE